MELPLLIKHRLIELRRGQKELAAAAQVTESYISQLLKGRRVPPASGRTDIYDKIERFLKLPIGTLSQMADVQRTEALKKKLADPPGPLFKDVRGLILRKCEPRSEKAVRAIFEKEPFGALERLVTQKLLDVAQRVARQELKDENWLRLVARQTGRSYRQVRVEVLDFLETDVFNLSIENCQTFLEPLLESWHIDLATFGLEVVLNRRLVPEHRKRFEFVEREHPFPEEPGLRAFLGDRSLSGDATAEEIGFLRTLRFTRARPTALYYYRELQSLRDPLHFAAERG
ncbi:MAG TPA: helix-turn-helix transcriptional regulator [Vicinamibacterales bacterium]|nr:helix-turn-helix transcriptional regulator [Vicinamibacterales bacterium]